MNILITGASRGIGAATFNLFRSNGHAVAGHSTAGSDDLIAANFTDPASPRTLWEAAVERLGHVDVLVNNAGIYEGIPDDAPEEEWHAAWARTLMVNLQATADLSRLAVAHFRARGSGGRIVNISSRAGHRGDSPDHWHYAASKAAILGMTKTIARGYARENILAFAVCPGFTMTGMVEDFMASRGIGDQVVAEIPLGRVSTADEVAETIRWLAIDAPAASTGSIVDVNGASYVR
ncbi:MAG: SDR family oxidoreductase [Sphingomonas sp.]|uniref:SDR family NAD(P)-dependent oxidoreductase n=1 Tax=Sphingomonas sp. TaxID=28214 RepID=UPI00179521C8|nr:SDR family oxidoreductase [Sphingomonas sp.]MBA3667689.1 SDR family oxidoreductase [Sphingomonas sp.]